MVRLRLHLLLSIAFTLAVALSAAPPHQGTLHTLQPSPLLASEEGEPVPEGGGHEQTGGQVGLEDPT